MTIDDENLGNESIFV